MTDTELLDRLIDAIALLERAEVYSKNPTHKRYKKAVAANYLTNVRDYYRSCHRAARQASFKRRGILPHGANGRILYPEGTRGYHELDEPFKKEWGTGNLNKDFFGNRCCSLLLVYVGMIGIPDKQEVMTCVLLVFLEMASRSTTF